MTTASTPIPDDYDTPWKEAIEHHFPEFMAFYFPQAHRQIDWRQGHTFLDQELQAVVQDGELGKRFVDKLVQVNRLTGQEDWIYIHLEVQGSAQAEFAERMFVYNYRIYDRYRRPVASMAVLADDTPSWKPTPTRLPWSRWSTCKPEPPAQTRKHVMRQSGSWCSCCTAGVGTSSESLTCFPSLTG